MRNKIGLLMLTVMILSVSVVFAHHGNAIYDTKVTVLEGTVVEWLWTNPHCLLDFDVMGADGKAVRWNVEVSNPPDMIRQGWSRKMFKPGDKVSVSINAAKNGQPVGRMTQVVVDGKTFRGMGGAPPADGATK